MFSLIHDHPPGADNNELARQRQALPWVRVDKDYRFDTEQGTASLADLFQKRSQLLVYHLIMLEGNDPAGKAFTMRTYKQH